MWLGVEVIFKLEQQVNRQAGQRVLRLGIQNEIGVVEAGEEVRNRNASTAQTDKSCVCHAVRRKYARWKLGSREYCRAAWSFTRYIQRWKASSRRNHRHVAASGICLGSKRAGLQNGVRPVPFKAQERRGSGPRPHLELSGNLPAQSIRILASLRRAA